MSVRDRMKHKLMLLARLPGPPSDGELNAIISDILKIQKTRTPTEGDWRDSAGQHVRGAGTHKRAGEDLSDLNTLLMQLMSASPSAGPRPQGSSGTGGSNTVRK